jgi:ABC-type dipeptide/oligopeptide/nickel transport system permease component
MEVFVCVAMLDVLSGKYLVTARAKGLPERQVILRHALKNAAVPIVTQIGLQLRFVIGGSVITESIFGWPGLGRLMVGAVFSRDYPVVEASVAVFAVILTAFHATLDILYTYLNPKIRL